MNTISWIKNVAPPGSDNYYALRKIKPEKQDAIKIILALFDTILKIPFTLQDDNLVRIKLRWWKEEIIKTQQNHASHPLCIELFSVMQTYELNYNAVLQMISAIENIIQNCQFSTEQSLRDFYTYTYGIRERMIAKIISPEASQFSESIHHLAYSLALIDNLKHIRQRALKTYVFFSDEEARELNVDKNSVLTLKRSDALKKLFERQIEKAREHFNTGRATTGGSPLRPLFIRNHLSLKWCELVRDENFPLFTHHIELTPLRKWWYSRKPLTPLQKLQTCRKASVLSSLTPDKTAL